MWILVWLQFVNGDFNYYQIDFHGTQQECLKEKEKASVLVSSINTAVVCLEAKAGK